jgi:hypothetical protein
VLVIPMGARTSGPMLFLACAACGSNVLPDQVRSPDAPRADIGVHVGFFADLALVFAEHPAHDPTNYYTFGSAPLPDVDKTLIRGTLPSLRACYAVGLLRDSSLHGWLTLLLGVDAQGHVRSTTVTNCHFEVCGDDAPPEDQPFPDANVAECVASTLRSLHFVTARDAKLQIPLSLSTNPFP